MVENEMACVCYNSVVRNCAYKSWPVNLVGIFVGEIGEMGLLSKKD